MGAKWSIQTPTGAPGAVGVVQLWSESAAGLDAALGMLGIAPVAVGRIALRDLCGVDRGLVARWTGESAHLMPHGGGAVLRALSGALFAAGIRHADPDPRALYPEARGLLEARMLSALSRAASPLAVDLLLDQPRRWEATPSDTNAQRDRVLRRLIDPPLVVAIGAPNIGKSSLTNALAGRPVSLVADEPGTTRDHVGVALELSGLVVRYLDTPGIRGTSEPAEIEAAEIARQIARDADLLLLCGDASAEPPSPGRAQSSLTLALRADLGLPSWPHDLAMSARTGTGLAPLAAAIRERLVPAAALAHPGPWRFWGDGP